MFKIELLPKISKLLHISIDELLGIKETYQSLYPPKIEKKMKTISNLPRRKQDYVLNVIDALIK